LIEEIFNEEEAASICCLAINHGRQEDQLVWIGTQIENFRLKVSTILKNNEICKKNEAALIFKIVAIYEREFGRLVAHGLSRCSYKGFAKIFSLLEKISLKGESMTHFVSYVGWQMRPLVILIGVVRRQ
jgi:hypothetical protein